MDQPSAGAAILIGSHDSPYFPNDLVRIDKACEDVSWYAVRIRQYGQKEMLGADEGMPVLTGDPTGSTKYRVHPGRELCKLRQS
jgi:hypothetical protein